MADAFSAIEIVNRRSVAWEGMFDGQALVFQPHERKHYPPNVAYALAEQSTLRIDLASGVETVFALGIPGEKRFPATPLDGPLANRNAVEILDRSNVEKLTETEPKVLGEDGEAELGIGKASKTVTHLPGSDPNPDSVVQMASADDVQTVKFVNQDVRRGTSRPGRAEHRMSFKTGQ